MDRWPQLEDGYLMQIQLGIHLRDPDRIGRMLELIEKRGIYLTPGARKTVEFWKKDEDSHDIQE